MSLTKRQKVDNGLEKSSALAVSSDRVNQSILYSDAIVLEGHEGSALSVNFDHSGSRIISTGLDKTIRLWNLPIDEHDESPNYGVISGHKAAVTSAKWLHDDLTIVSGSADSTIGFWDGETGQRTRKCIGHELTINQIDVSSDMKVLSVGDDGSAKLWDQRQKSATGEVKTDYPLLSGTFSNQGGVIYFAGIDPRLKAFDIRKLDQCLWECEAANDSITSVAINNDDSALLTRSMNGSLRTLSAKDYIPEGISRMNPYVYDGAPSGNELQLIRATFSNNNVAIASGSEDHTVTVFDFISRKILNKFGGHRGTTLDVDYHPTEKIIASCSTDGSVIVRAQ